MNAFQFDDKDYKLKIFDASGGEKYKSFIIIELFLLI